MRCSASVILLGLFALGHAAEAVDAAARTAAAELLTAMKTPELVSQTIEAGFQQGVKPFLDQAPEEQRASLQKGVDAAAAFLREHASWASMEGEYVDLYARTFTTDELTQLAAFYRSPIGQRLVERTPELTVKGMEFGAERMRTLMPQLQRIMGEAIEQAQAESVAQKYAAAGLVVGQPFPELTLTATDGSPVSTASLRGKVVLVDYWATWCTPCVRELPTLLAAYKRYHPKGFEVIAISLDEDTDKLARFVAEKKVPWKQVCDGEGWQSGLAKRFGIESIPATFLIARDGTLAAIGLRGDDLAPAVEKALGAPAP